MYYDPSALHDRIADLSGRGGEVMGKLYVNDRKLDELILAAKFVLEGLDNLGLSNMRTTLRLKVAIEALSKGGDGCITRMIESS